MSVSADRAGFEEFVVARRRALLRTAYLLTGSHADAEDLVQVALVKVVPHWRKIADDPEPYVRRVLARESVSRWRRRRWRELTTDDLPDAGSRTGAGTDTGVDTGVNAGVYGGVDAGVVEREDLRRALLTLPPRQRAVVVLRYFDDLTERETAELLGVSIGTVKSQARDALASLRRRMPSSDVLGVG